MIPFLHAIRSTKTPHATRYHTKLPEIKLKKTKTTEKKSPKLEEELHQLSSEEDQESPKDIPESSDNSESLPSLKHSTSDHDEIIRSKKRKHKHEKISEEIESESPETDTFQQTEEPEETEIHTDFRDIPEPATEELNQTIPVPETFDLDDLASHPEPEIEDYSSEESFDLEEKEELMPERKYYTLKHVPRITQEQGHFPEETYTPTSQEYEDDTLYQKTPEDFYTQSGSSGKGFGKPFFPMTEENLSENIHEPQNYSESQFRHVPETDISPKERSLAAKICYYLDVVALLMTGLKNFISQKLRLMFLLYFAICFPFVAVYMKRGLSKTFFLNLFLCFCFYFPGIIHSIYICTLSQ